MPKAPERPQWPDTTAPSLLSRASAVLAREALRLPGALVEASPPGPPVVPLAAPSVVDDLGQLAPQRCPVTGARTSMSSVDGPGLRAQAQDLLASLLAMLGQFPGSPGTPGRSSLPTGFDQDTLRRQAHEFIESLLIAFHQATGEQGASADDRVPAIQCMAPVQPGSEARATLRVANEEPTPSDVSLYCTNFVADSGYEIPALRVSIAPRRVTIPPNGEAAFEIKIAVPQQTARGIYSGLIQAMGSKFVKAVLSIDVL